MNTTWKRVVTYAVWCMLVVIIGATPGVAAQNDLLSGVELRTGQLVQPFSPNVTSYIVIVPETEAALHVTPYVSYADARITVSINGDEEVSVGHGEESPPLRLEIGNNIVDLRVVTGESEQTYQFIVPKRAIRLQQGVAEYNGTADTQLVQAVKYTAHNLGAQHKYEVGYTGPWARDQKYVLIRFEDLPLPEDATVIEASLNLWYFGDRASTGQDIVLKEREVYAHRVRVAWNEGAGGDENTHDGHLAQDGEVTWDSFMSQPAPFHFNIEDTVLIGEEAGWYAWDITELVQAWHDGTYPNYGVLLKTYEYPENGDERMTGTKQFRSSEYSVVEERPFLDVVYTVPLQGVTVSGDTYHLTVGDKVNVEAFPRPLHAEYDAIVWESTDSSVVRADAGIIEAVAAGTAIVTAKVLGPAGEFAAAIDVYVR